MNEAQLCVSSLGCENNVITENQLHKLFVRYDNITGYLHLFISLLFTSLLTNIIEVLLGKSQGLLINSLTFNTGESMLIFGVRSLTFNQHLWSVNNSKKKIRYLESINLNTRKVVQFCAIYHSKPLKTCRSAWDS